MLKNIPAIISPELLKILDEMGHGDYLIIGDGNFPAESLGRSCKVIRMDGHNVPEVLEAILKLYPLDTYVKHPVILMERIKGDMVETSIWEEYKKIINKHDPRGEKCFKNIERFEFYEIAKKAYCIIMTTEKVLYANILLQKGVILEE